MRSPARRWEWVVASAPVICALLVYSLAQGRWLLGGPLIAGTVWALARGIRIERRPWKLTVTAAIGAALGLILFLQESGPPGPIPPVVLSPLSAALAGICVYVLLSRQPMYAWLYSWLLAVLSLLLPPQGPIVWVFLAHVASTLACCFVLGAESRRRWSNLVGFTVFAAFVSVIGFGLTRLALGSEEALLNAASRWLSDLEPPGGVGLQSEIVIGSRSSIGRSNRALLELDGKRPDYLRTHVMENFDGALWGASALARGAATRGPLRENEAQASSEQSLTFLERLEDVIPAPAGTMAVEGTPARPERGWVWRALAPPGRTLTLRHTELEQLPFEEAPGPLATKLPENLQEEFKPLAMPIVEGAATTRQKADRIERFFQSQFLYSLNTDLRGAGHPLSVLIRERRPAYCIYFASAMAVLLRSMNVPARLVGGFAPSEVNPFTKRTVVRVRDAHAWVEAYIAEEGRWVTFDPTPSQSREQVIDEQKSKWLGQLWEAFVSVVRRSWMAFKDDPFGTISAMVLSPPGLLFIALLLVWQVRKRWSGFVIRRKQVALESSDPELRAAYREYRAMLNRLRIVPATDETEDDLIARVKQTAGERSAEAAANFVADYRRARYGGGSKERLRESLSALDDAMKRAG